MAPRPRDADALSTLRRRAYGYPRVRPLRGAGGRPAPSAVEDAGFDQPLLRGVPAVVGVRLGERGQLGTDLGAVTGADQRTDLLDELVGVGGEPGGTTGRDVADVGVPPVVERN